MNQPVDLLILSNGPGEVTTWVRPVVECLAQQLGEERSRVRISLVLSPCTHATGKEGAIARSYPQIDRVQDAPHFWNFLLWGKTAENWDWHKRGLVLFLGGDQAFAVLLGKRLGYPIITYVEWEARWLNHVQRVGVMNEKAIAKAPPKYRTKLTIVGDLMTDVGQFTPPQNPEEEWIGLLPGSKAMKLAQGVPFCCALVEYIHQQRPQTRFVIPVAPTLDIDTLAQFANPDYNPILSRMGNVGATLIHPDGEERPYLLTPQGVKILLWPDFPAYDILTQCRICFTTIGANTAQLAALGVPMIVGMSTQQLDAMRAWDGLPGLLANLPLFGKGFALLINWVMMQYTLKTKRLYAWPNLWAKREIVPELVGALTPEQIGKLMIDYLEHPERLEAMKGELAQVRGEGGAAQQLSQLVISQL
ncbi:lipid-A-disaccharide synthase [Spirulina subsalsa FACHB-351]|uniref:Lipid-A-disaccharide synthase n=1 Tax=Spirulina subsalsa FACHB-351 TaxID=234711 RepID=A0ABT3KZS3_9CYAN|nr:lipid-A-disaccharide synthase [Spirulina subsalsa]MCW6034740.1 lipid-A-disaccharide synthase [Spirulina subsalsa FACHB-351]